MTANALLIAPSSAIDTHAGGGQRTAVFVSALKRAGFAVQLLVIGHRPIESHCTLASDVDRTVWSSQWAEAPISQRKQRERIRPTLITRFRPDEHASSALISMLEKTPPEILVYRYAQSFLRSSLYLPQSGQPKILIDIDDREDLLPFEPGRPWLRSAMRVPAIRSAMHSHVRSILRSSYEQASHLWVAKQEDAVGLPPVMTSIAPNVPFGPARIYKRPSQADATVLLVGSATHSANTRGAAWFVESVWPTIRERIPGCGLRIVGGGGWSTVFEGKAIPPDVTIVGPVDSLEREYNNARLAICPVFEGGGTKIKVLEACSYARPIVSTKLGASGFGPGLGALIPVADDSKTFAERVSHLLIHTGEADALGDRLHAAQTEGFSREVVESSIANDIQQIVAA